MAKSKPSPKSYRFDNELKESLKKRVQNEKRNESSIVRDAVKKYLNS